MKRNKRMAGLLLVILTAMLLFPFQVLAAGSIDKEKPVTLTLSYQRGDNAIIGAPFDIYLVAEVDEFGELTPTEAFKDFNVMIRGANDEAWKDLATTLEGYVLRDKIPATQSGKTDRNGMLTFPVAKTGTDGQTETTKLTQGLYLVLGSRYRYGSRIYDPSSFMALLPSQDQVENVWDYDIAVTPKYDSHVKPDEDNPSGGDVTRSVLKVWKDNGYEENRPQEITVDLLENGEVYDTVTLSAANNWKYTWKNLKKDSKWTVVEEEVDDYYVKVAREGTTFVVTNTRTEIVPDNPTPGGDAPDKPVTPDTPDGPGGGVLGAEDYIGDLPIPMGVLPQTGQYWWLAHLLFGAGVLCLMAGLLRRKMEK